MAFFIKHKRHASLRPDIAAALGEGAAHIGRCAVLIVRQSVYNYRNSIGAVSFVCKVLVIDRSGVARRFLNAPLNGVIRHIVRFRLGNHVPQTAVVRRIRAAFLHRHSQLAADYGKDLALCGVVLLLFVLNIRKFRMS